MAESIHFHCPACATTLSLPVAMAALRGPCPACGREIIAPDPATGVGSHEAPEEVAPTLPQPPEPPEPLAAVVAGPVRMHPQRTILVISCLLTGVVGYLLGTRATPLPRALPPERVAIPAVIPPPVLPPAAPPVMPVPPVPLRVKPVISTPEPPAPAKASAAAEAALRAFLEAPDWAARRSDVLVPEKIRGAMEAYSRSVPDGPTPFQSLAVKQSHLDPQTGRTLYIFFVATGQFPAGIPVAVQETTAGWLVDWQTFVEFRDGLFQQFVAGPVDRSGTFHLVVTTPPTQRAANTENEHFSSFLLQPPLAATPQLAFVRKTSEAFKTFQAALGGGGLFTPVLEVVKRKTAAGESYFEVLKVAATDWLPAEQPAARSEAETAFPAP